MRPDSPEVRTSANETAAPATASLSPIISQIESRWSTERPQDLAALSALLEALRDATKPAEINEWSTRLQKLQSAVEPAEQVPSDELKWLSALGEVESLVGGRICPVFFGTNRAPLNLTEPQLGFSSERAGLVTYGRCDLWVPTMRRFGRTGSSWWRRWLKGLSELIRLRTQFTSDEIRLKRIIPMTRAEFLTAVATRAIKQKEPAIGSLIFLHGYNVCFSDAVIRAAQLALDLHFDGAMTLFSWPSKGVPGRYDADIAAIEASEAALTEFLADFARESGEARVHLLAHSMGNRGLLRALQRLASDATLATGVKFGQVLLAAPDVDRDLFLGLAPLYSQFSERTTLYASNGDRAVAMSAWLNRGPRAGYFNATTHPAVAMGVDRFDTVEVPDFDLDLLGHSYYAEADALLHDMFDLLRRGAPPADRQRLFRKDDHWEMRH